MKKKERFKWMEDCEEDFQRVKAFLMSPPILTFPREESPLLLYLFVTDHVMSSVLVQETNKVENHVYFVSKVFRGTEA